MYHLQPSCSESTGGANYRAYYCTATVNLFRYFSKLKKAPVDKVLEFSQKTKTCGKQKCFHVSHPKNRQQKNDWHAWASGAYSSHSSSLSSASCRKKQTLFPNFNDCLNQSCVLQQHQKIVPTLEEWRGCGGLFFSVSPRTSALSASKQAHVWVSIN